MCWCFVLKVASVGSLSNQINIPVNGVLYLILISLFSRCRSRASLRRLSPGILTELEVWPAECGSQLGWVRNLFREEQMTTKTQCSFKRGETTLIRDRATHKLIASLQSWYRFDADRRMQPICLSSYRCFSIKSWFFEKNFCNRSLHVQINQLWDWPTGQNERLLRTGFVLARVSRQFLGPCLGLFGGNLALFNLPICRGTWDSVPLLLCSCILKLDNASLQHLVLWRCR